MDVELDHKESWALKNWCFSTMVLENNLESSLDYKEIQPVHSKGDQPWDFFGRNDTEAEAPVLWPPHVKSWLIGKDSDAGRDWGQEEKGMTEDEMAGWHHGLNGCEFGWTLGVGDGQGGLSCCDSWGRQESDISERLNWTDRNRLTVMADRLVAAKGKAGMGRMDWEFGISRCKLVYIEWVNNKETLFNILQQTVMENHMEKKKIYRYV